MNTVTLSTHALSTPALPAFTFSTEDMHQAGLQALPSAQRAEAELLQLPAAMRRLEAISLGVILRLLDAQHALKRTSGLREPRSSAQIIAELGAAPRHHWLVRRWLAALVEREFLSLHEGQYTYHEALVVESLEGADALADAYAALGFPPIMAQAHQTLIDNLDGLLRDSVNINTLLFQDGQILNALAAYQTNCFTHYLNHALGFVVKNLALTPKEAHDKFGQKANMLNLLELGGGAGLTTSAVLECLQGRPINYTFTDVSTLFTQAIEDKFPYQVGLKSHLLDINIDFSEQPVANASVDVVIAGNVLHNAAHIGDSLTRIRSLLKPGGVLLFTESVRENYAMLTAMQFLLSPTEGNALLGSHDRRASDENLFLDANAWQAELHNAGFELVSSLLTDEQHTSSTPVQAALAAAGQALFIAVAKGSASAAHPPRDTHITQPLDPQIQQHQQAQLQACALQHPDVDHAVAVQTSTTQAWSLFIQTTQTPNRVHHTDSDLAHRINAQLASQFEHVDMQRAVAVTDALNHTALLSMLNALSHFGFFTASNVHQAHSVEDILNKPPVADAHRPLIRRWLKVLTEAGLLTAEGTHYRLAIDPAQFSDAAMAHAWTTLGDDWQALSSAQQTIDYARENAQQLPAIIRGEIQAVHLLFPRGTTERASALYREGVAARYQQGAVRTLLERIANDWQQHMPAGTPLQIIEVGAGTGATTEGMLPMLDTLSQTMPIDYQFTDVSTAFADSFFAKHNPTHAGQCKRPWLRRGLYDIDATPRSQGMAENSVDVVIAGGVFNAARDTDASLAWVKHILRPGGWFIMTEPTTEEFWVMASQAFMLAHAQDDRAEAEATFLSLPQWHQALEGAGLQLVLDLPPAEHPLSAQGHRVFALRAKTECTRVTQAEMHAWFEQQATSTLPQPMHIEVVDNLPLTASGEVDRHTLQDWANKERQHD